MNDDPTCVCGHVADEHQIVGGECTVDGCDCIHFEADLDEEEHGA